MILGITGFKGSGKSTVAKYLNVNHGFTRVNFKDALIEEIKMHMPNTLKELSEYYSMSIDDLFEIKPPIMRALMVDFGTELRRAEDKNYWTKQWLKKVEEIKGNIVVDDVRFDNELEAIRSLGGRVIRVKRDDITSGGDHESETAQIKFEVDFTIEGQPGSHREVYNQTEEILRLLNND